MQRKGELTIKQQKFIKEYIASDGNGTQAALKAYNTTDNNVAHNIASENLQKPTVREAIEKALVRLKITPDYVLGMHKGIAETQLNKDPNVSVRALENIGKIADYYPKSNGNIEIGDGKLKISWEN